MTTKKYDPDLLALKRVMDATAGMDRYQWDRIKEWVERRYLDKSLLETLTEQLTARAALATEVDSLRRQLEAAGSDPKAKP